MAKEKVESLYVGSEIFEYRNIFGSCRQIPYYHAGNLSINGGKRWRGHLLSDRHDIVFMANSKRKLKKAFRATVDLLFQHPDADREWRRIMTVDRIMMLVKEKDPEDGVHELE